MGIKHCINSVLREKETVNKTIMKYNVKQFLKLDLDKLPIRKIRELLCNFNSEALKINKNIKKIFHNFRRAIDYCNG